MIQKNGMAKVEEYIHHRGHRETQIVNCLCAHRLDSFSGATNDDSSNNNNNNRSDVGWISSWSIMTTVYEHDLQKMPLIIKLSAQSSTIHHLEKLMSERRVENKWPDLWRIVHL